MLFSTKLKSWYTCCSLLEADVAQAALDNRGIEPDAIKTNAVLFNATDVAEAAAETEVVLNAVKEDAIPEVLYDADDVAQAAL